MPRRFQPKKSFRQTLVDNKKALDMYAALSGRPTPHESDFVVNDKRQRGPTDQATSEAGVMSEVKMLLGIHPKVLLAVRQNSGAAGYQDQHGHYVPVWFYNIVRCPEAMTITDWWGFLYIDKTPVPFAIECKNRKWLYKATDREVRQKAFIDMVIDCGGRGGFVRSAEEAQRVIEC